MQITATAGDRTPIGHITSAYAQGSMNRPVVLAMVEDGRARVGKTVYVQMPAGAAAATVSDRFWSIHKASICDA